MAHEDYVLSPWPPGVNPAEVRRELAEEAARQQLEERFGITPQGLELVGMTALEVINGIETVSISDVAWATLYSV